MTDTHMTLGRLFFCILITLIADSLRAQIPYGMNSETGRFLESDGARIYFETYGQGRPLVLIHGNGGSIGYMKPQIEYFARHYRVIVMDCRGRGKSELGADSLTYMQMTKDIVAILNHLRVDSAYVVGRSDGGIIALLLAIYYPEKVGKAVSFAPNLTPDTTALTPAFFRAITRDRMHADSMLALHDTTQNWKVLQQRNRLMEFQPRISTDDLHRITCPVLVMSTDRDIIPLSHTMLIYDNIAKANLSILAGEDHYVSSSKPDLFNTTVARYLDAFFVARQR